MNDFGPLVSSIKPENIRLFGNGVIRVDVYSGGVKFERKKGSEEYLFNNIDKIIAQEYASPNPVHIYITVFIKNPEKKIKFDLSVNLADTNCLLGAYSDFLLTERFPENLSSLDIELGGLGTSIALRNGAIYAGKKIIPLREVESFTPTNFGCYYLKVSSIDKRLAISPMDAPNIVASIRIINEIIKQNRLRS